MEYCLLPLYGGQRHKNVSTGHRTSPMHSTVYELQSSKSTICVYALNGAVLRNKADSLSDGDSPSRPISK